LKDLDFIEKNESIKVGATNK
jgi:hypothetical protein